MRFQENQMSQSLSSRFMGRLGFKRRWQINCRSRIGGMGPYREEIGRYVGCGIPPPLNGTEGFPLRLAREGDMVRIVGLTGGRGFHNRLAGMGLRTGVDVKVIKNSMGGKMLIGLEGTRLYLGGGMAQKIRVINIRGGNQ